MHILWDVDAIPYAQRFYSAKKGMLCSFAYCSA